MFRYEHISKQFGTEVVEAQDFRTIYNAAIRDLIDDIDSLTIEEFNHIIIKRIINDGYNNSIAILSAYRWNTRAGIMVGYFGHDNNLHQSIVREKNL